MKISVQREALLAPLQYIIGAVERRQTKPILGHVLIREDENGISLTATDLEIELVAYLQTTVTDPRTTTLPARKLLDICRSLPDNARLDIQTDSDRATVRSGRSRFTLASLPAGDFPVLEDFQESYSVELSQSELKTLFDRTAFAMAQQDVRYYLNGLLLEISGGKIRTVATDGHRLGMFDVATKFEPESVKQVIIPRKGVLELQRLLEETDTDTKISLTTNHIRVNMPMLRFTSKLIDGRFPDYKRVLPHNTDKILRVERETFRQALIRASILSNEKYRGIRLIMGEEKLKIQAHNPEQEEAEEEMEASYSGEALELGFNVNYLLDVLNVIEYPSIEMHLKDSDSSVLAKSPVSDEGRYVVMPMRL